MSYRSSSNITVGLGNEARNSSKILKPPGGGTSDIFGYSETDSTLTKTKTSASPPHPASAVIPHQETNGLESASHSSTPNSSTSPSPPPPQTKPAQPNPVTGEGYDPESTPTRPTNRRVPPGGFSSKLW